jgi:hypothetical protein
MSKRMAKSFFNHQPLSFNSDDELN